MQHLFDEGNVDDPVEVAGLLDKIMTFSKNTWPELDDATTYRIVRSRSRR